MLASMSCTQCG